VPLFAHEHGVSRRNTPIGDRAPVDAEDIEKAREFSDSSDLRETMQKAWVVDKPDIYFLGAGSTGA
jgi:hypothetical protein